MPVFNNILAGAAGSGGAAGDFKIERSLRFNDNDSAYLSRTFTGGNRKTWTWSGWFKRSGFSEQVLFIAKGNGSPNPHNGIWIGGDRLSMVAYPYNFALTPSKLLRDPGAWYHFVVAFDTTIASPSSDRIKMWINGELQTQFHGTVTYPSQDFEGLINDNNQLAQIGQWDPGYNRFLDGYLAEVHFIDGQALSATDFGAFDSNGVWNPIQFTGNHNVGNGANGFYLDFSDNTSTTTLGNDAAGSNNWTLNNFSAAETDVTHWRQATGSDWPSSGHVGSLSAKSQITISDPQSGSLVWDHQNTQVIGLQNITGITSLRLLISSRGGAKLGINTGAMFNFGNHGGDYSNAQANAAWYTVNNPPSTLTSIAATGGGMGTGNFLSVWGIEVNGTRVVDASGSDCDTLIDSPTNYDADSGNNGGNYATLNPLNRHNTSNDTLSNGNLNCSMGGGSAGLTPSTIAFSSGKFYYEVVFTTNGSDSVVGIRRADSRNYDNTYMYHGSGNKHKNGSPDATYGDSFTNGDVIGTAVDMDNGTISFYKNGVSQGQAFGIDAGTYTFIQGMFGGTNGAYSVNFGQRPFSISSVPTGFKSLCTQNLTDPLINKGSDHFIAKKYNGSSGDKVVTTGFQPDLVWIKNRTQARWHRLADSVRGVERNLYTNSQSGEDNSNNYNHKSFTSTGFTVWDTDRDTNSSHGDGYISWSWNGGSTFSNNAGSNGASIASSGTANTAAGFSIVSYTGTGNAGTVKHGLNTTPEMIWFKGRNFTDDWRVYHKQLDATEPEDYYLQLHSTNGRSADQNASFMNNAAPTSSVFSLGTDSAINGSTRQMIAYCFAPTDGYCAVGKFSGNGNSDGAFAYTGFTPAFVMIKSNYNYDGGGSIVNGYNWFMYDNERSEYNLTDDILAANKAFTEESNAGVDFLSNGFKMRNQNAPNASYDQYYIAFAEHPFKYARAR